MYIKQAHLGSKGIACSLHNAQHCTVVYICMFACTSHCHFISTSVYSVVSIVVNILKRWKQIMEEDGYGNQIVTVSI